ncbi:phytyl ester synthase 2, chloroplastic isoform X2 [Raphanus sativus]|uniref:Phytyl ester synthase 2, chloroplastic isoform X2 n=1 Tax=Raphanus sativus TaxID=3726 RepID=A0A9W3BW74_RAPSA|nr:phytyl ester synthase 2, chloroplastic isoform X2 [Raphanus sativus]
MEVTLLGSVYGLSPFSLQRVCNAGFSSFKSNTRRQTYRVTAINPVEYLKTHGGARRIRKNEDGAAVAKMVESPYSKVETASPDLHKSLSDFLEEARDFVGDDDGPPRWFSPLECSSQAQGSPLLLFIPGIDGTGLGLVRHHKKLGEVFDVWCLHIPDSDRTPAKDLVNIIERTVRSENHRFPNRPIYLVGESIGACLALDVAARNPNIDLALILANPGDSLTARLDALTNELAVHQMSGVSGGMLRDLFAVSANLPDTLLWKLELLKSAVASANSHIYAVRAETLILLSGRDQWLLNEEDINRYSRTLPKCIVRKLKGNGHFLFFEEGVDLVTIIKCTCFYRRGKSHDHLSDYIMPTRYELKQQLDNHKLQIGATTSPVYLSTLEDGKIVRGLEGIPSEGPVLFVGYHMLLGLELIPMISQILKERNIHLRGLAHPMLFLDGQDVCVDPQIFDKFKLIGGVPVSKFSIYKLLSSKSHVLLYPGGIREAFHKKGEEYKLFWPEQPEFVRVASKFGAKIVPFGVVGEDDICHFVLDSDDQRNIPFLKDFMEEATRQAGNVREGDETELGNQKCYLPVILPKIPGRLYFYFGKPIETAGKGKELKDKDKAQEFYLQVKSEVEQCIEYLKMKRESDPYRHLLPRMMYQASHGGSSEIPTFDL